MDNDAVKQAENAINKVFGDMSVSQAETKEKLKDLTDFIQVMIEALELED